MEDTMRYWLGVVCREQREKRDRLQVHVAASLDRNQSTVARFERGDGWPQDPDITVAAYADDLDMDPVELWTLALERWQAEGRQPKLAELKERRDDEVAKRRARRASAGRRRPPRPAPDHLPQPQDPQPDEEADPPGKTRSA